MATFHCPEKQGHAEFEVINLSNAPLLSQRHRKPHLTIRTVARAVLIIQEQRIRISFKIWTIEAQTRHYLTTKLTSESLRTQ
jgi:hypothetical protein